MIRTSVAALSFAVAAALPCTLQAQSTWTAAVTDNWTRDTRWSPTGVPNGADVDVLLSATGPDYTVVLNGGQQVTLSSLTINSSAARLFITEGARLSVNGSVNIDAGTLLLQGGTIAGTITGNGLLQGGGTFDGVTLGMTLSMNVTNDYSASVVNGLTLAAGGSIAISAGNNTLSFLGTQTLGGSGEVDLYAGGARLRAVDGVLTIAPTITVTARQGAYGHVGDGSGNGSVINRGVIQSSAASYMTLNGLWTNQGTLRTNGGTLRLGGTFRVADIGTIDRSGGGTVEIVGTLDASGTVFNPHSGSHFELVNVNGVGPSVITGGLILPAIGTNLISRFGHITDSIIAGLVQVPGYLAVRNVSFMPGGEIFVNKGQLAIGTGELIENYEIGSQTVSGPGVIRLSDGGIGSYNSHVTLGPGLTIIGAAGRSAVQFNHDFVTYATFKADGGTLGVGSLLPWKNQGQLIATNGGTLSVGNVDVGGLGSFDSTGGKIYIGGLNNADYDLRLDGTKNIIHVSGVIRGGQITASNGAYVVSDMGQFYDVRLDTDMELIDGGADVRGVSWAEGRIVRLLGNGHLRTGDAVLGDATFIFDDKYASIGPSGTTGFTISDKTTIKTRGEGGIVGQYNSLNRSFSYANNGNLLSEVNGLELMFGGNPRDILANNGTIRAADGGTLRILGNLTNTGTVSVTNGSADLNIAANTGTIAISNADVTLRGLPQAYGNFSMAGGNLAWNFSSTTGFVKSLPITPNTITFNTGTIDNAGQTLYASEAGRAYYLGSGTIAGGTLGGPSEFTVVGLGGSLSNVSIGTNLRLNDQTSLKLINGTSTDGPRTITLVASATLELDPTANLAPGTEILITGGGPRLRGTAGNALTIASGVTVRGNSYGAIGLANLATSIAGTVVAHSTQQLDLSGHIDLTGLLDVRSDITVNPSGSGSGSSLTNRGTIDMGPAGDLRVLATYTQTSLGTLELNLAGTTAELVPLLLVSGTATLGGTLDVNLVNGYKPVHGDNFMLISSATGLVGNFDTINLPDISGISGWQISNDGKIMTLTAMPEPATLSTLLLGGVALLRRRRGRTSPQAPRRSGTSPCPAS